MLRAYLYLLTISILQAATVETALLGPGPSAGPTPLSAIDSRGNVILVNTTGSGCDAQQRGCVPLVVTKLNAQGQRLWQITLARASAPTALTMDRADNILIAASVPDLSLPTVNALPRPVMGTSPYAFLWQIAPDGARALFASYLASGTVSRLYAHEGGEITATIVTTEFLVTTPPQHLVAARIAPAKATLVSVLLLPLEAAGAATAFGRDGSVQLVERRFGPGIPYTVVSKIDSAGNRTEWRPPLPASPVNLVQPASDGGTWIAGVAAPSLATTPGAFEGEPRVYSYQRWEDAQGVTPDGPMRTSLLRKVFVDPTNRNRIFATSDRGVLRSDDNGWTWQVIYEDPDSAYFGLYLAVGGGRVWLSTRTPTEQTLVSDDAGSTWRPADLPAAFRFGTLFPHPTRAETVFVLLADRFSVTRDGGKTWAPLAAGSGEIVVDPRAPDTIAICTPGPSSVNVPNTGRILVSRDGGATFGSPLSAGRDATDFQFDPATPGLLFYLSRGSLFRVPVDGAASTTVMTPMPAATLALHPSEKGVMFITSFDGHLFRSPDGGATWLELNSNRIPAPVQRMAAGEGGVLHFIQSIVPNLFVAKLDCGGNLESLSYLNGQKADQISQFQLTPQGYLLVAGQTDSPDFPTTAPRLRGEPAAPTTRPSSEALFTDIFVTVFANNGVALSSTVLAGADRNQLLNVRPNADGTIYILGTTASPDFPGLPAGANVLPQYFFSRLTP